MNPPRVGAQLFINRHDTAEDVSRWMKRMSEARFTLVRLFLAWDHLEPRENDWQWAVYDRAFAEAEKQGLKVIGTLMSVSPPGWMRRTHGMQDVADIDDPEMWARSLDYVRRVVNRWHSSPALDSWILWNEPARTLSRKGQTLVHFRDYLERKYGKIEELNRRYYHQVGGFTELFTEKQHDGNRLEFGSHAEAVDFLDFTVESLMGKLKEIASEVRQIDPLHPVHVNPHRISQCLFDSGQSIWREAEIVDFMGCSAHPPWHSTRFPLDRVQQSIGLYLDLMRSATRDSQGRFWCTELQGGPTIYTAFRTSSPTGSEIGRWMWECVGAGAEAIVFWCFNCREDGYEAGEWSLCQMDGSPSPRLLTASELADVFTENASWFKGGKPVPEVAILCSEASQALGMIEGIGDEVGSPRNRQMAADAMSGAYLMLSDLGYEVAFIDEKGLREGRLPASVKTLIAPSCTALDAATLETLEKWVKAGGTLLADGLFGFKDRLGGLARDLAPRLTDLFGVEVLDCRPGNEVVFESGAPGWFFSLALKEIEAGRVMTRWPDGSVAVTEKKDGGRAVRIGTCFFQRYLSQPSPPALDLLASWLGANPSADLRLQSPTPGTRLRRLTTPRGSLAIVISESGLKDVKIIFEKEGWFQTPGHPLREVKAASTVSIPLDASGGTMILFNQQA